MFVQQVTCHGHDQGRDGLGNDWNQAGERYHEGKNHRVQSEANQVGEHESPEIQQQVALDLENEMAVEEEGDRHSQGIRSHQGYHVAELAERFPNKEIEEHEQGISEQRIEATYDEESDPLVAQQR